MWKKILAYIVSAGIVFGIGWWTGTATAGLPHDVAAEINGLENKLAESERLINASRAENRDLKSRIDRSVKLSSEIEQSIGTATNNIDRAIEIVNELIDYVERNRNILQGL